MEQRQLDGKVVITGAAGLVGQNLALLLRELGYTNIVAIDKQAANLRLLAALNPGVRIVQADLADPGAWTAEFDGAVTAVVLHAQITGKTGDPFVRNNVAASHRVFDFIRCLGLRGLHDFLTVLDASFDKDRECGCSDDPVAVFRHPFEPRSVATACR